jgi:hypothetical protein
MPELQHRLLPGQSALPTTVPLASRIGRLAIRSLYREVALAAKPGLVTPWGNGSHDDMDYATFMRSLHALRPYFPAIAACGSERPDFAPLQQLGIDAEADMLLATGGVNTHRGAIFNLGLLSAAAGWRLAEGRRSERGGNLPTGARPMGRGNPERPEQSRRMMPDSATVWPWPNATALAVPGVKRRRVFRRPSRLVYRPIALL